MSEVTVSFVVPAYNEEALIASCLHAILAETSRVRCGAEIIVVDNNSTDCTRRIVSAIPGVAIVDEPQRGLVQARRAGCLAASGQSIANIDADTMIPPGWLDTVSLRSRATPIWLRSAAPSFTTTCRNRFGPLSQPFTGLRLSVIFWCDLSFAPGR